MDVDAGGGQGGGTITGAIDNEDACGPAGAEAVEVEVGAEGAAMDPGVTESDPRWRDSAGSRQGCWSKSSSRASPRALSRSCQRSLIATIS
eukprot:6474588-Amphidinium_carterae.1